MKTAFRLAALLLLITAAAYSANGQSTIRGSITDTAGKPLNGIAVSLLYPADSTMAFFGITDGEGHYSIQAVANGSYVLQAAGLDFRTHYQTVNLPMASGGMLPAIRMQQITTINLEGVQVKGEKIPILLKKDTIEYNAGSFKTKPDAAVEDLLKKLPGVEVDKAGNIKAGGKDVEHVLVDGKEFFSNDHKVATKNLPADAIDKVQVFDGRSEQAQYTGIDDGERDRTINLMLKDGKRKGYFGDMEAGVGTDDRFKLGGHYFRFKKKSQFAALGTFNNINQSGFSLQDYFNFSGGLQSLLDGSNGGGFQLGADAPVNFGQQVTGLVTSGTAAMNYTYESKHGRYNVSYMGTGSEKKIDQQTLTQNFTDNGTFYRDDLSDEIKRDFGHFLNYSLRQDLDSFQQMRFGGNVSYATSARDRDLLSESRIRQALTNRLSSRIENDGSGVSASANLSYLRRSKGNWATVRGALNGSFDQSLSGTDWFNTTQYFQPVAQTTVNNQFQNNNGQKYNLTASLSAARRIGNIGYLEPELRAGTNSNNLERRQGAVGDEDNSIDSLSPKYSRRYNFVRPGLSFRHSTEKLQYSVSLRGEGGWLTSLPERLPHSTIQRSYLLPAASVHYSINNASNIDASYNSSVSPPTAVQMLPVTDYTNPLQRVHGNPKLAPEYLHNLHFGFHRFDAFDFTSFTAYFTGRYTQDKINLVRRINADLTEDQTYANLRDEYDLSGNVEYGMPIRKLGMTMRVGLDERYNRGMSLVNDVLNVNSTYTHGAKLTLGNRKKERWDAELKLTASYTESKYSVQQALNTSFVQYGANASLSYRPTDYLFFSANADIDRYQSRSFAGTITVPLVQASASYYFLKARRGALTLDAFDILDRNRSIIRNSQLNYLVEQRTNTIGRYFMLSFKYRLTATGGSNPDGMRIISR